MFPRFYKFDSSLLYQQEFLLMSKEYRDVTATKQMKVKQTSADFCLHGSLLFILKIHNFNVAGSEKDGAPYKDF